jgi:hypothetical protein
MQRSENQGSRGAADRDVSLQHGEQSSAPCTPPSAQLSTGATGSAVLAERSTTTEDSSRNGPASEQLHPFVYMAAVGLVFLFAASAWASFDDGEYTGFLLAVMTGFFSWRWQSPARCG